MPDTTGPPKRWRLDRTPAEIAVVEDILRLRAHGIPDAEIVEIVLAVALNTFTNYINEVARTEIDFPVVHANRAAA